MKSPKRHSTVTRLTAFVLLVSLATGIIVGSNTSAQTSGANSSLGNKTGRGASADYPALSRYARDLTKLASRGEIVPDADHAAEVGRVARALSAGSRRQPVVISESSGSSVSIARALAQKIDSGDAPANLRGKRVFSLDLDALAAGAKDEEEFASRFQRVLSEPEGSRGEVILFVDQLHQFVGSYANPTASASTREALGRGQLHLIGATTPEAYRQYIAGDEGLTRFFQTITADREDSSASNGDDPEGEGQGFAGDKISADLRVMLQSARVSGRERVSVILQTDDVNNEKLSTLLKRRGILIGSRLPQIGALKVEVPVEEVEALAASDGTRYVSLDRRVQSFGHVSKTTGADAVRPPTTTSAPGVTTATRPHRAGAGIAVLDSGMDVGHVAFLNKDGVKRVLFSKDFTGEGRIDDPYGHGTHVASTAAGNGRIAEAAYIGIAPEASLINLRVLNAQGVGSSSAVLGALDWVLANRAAYNIRVVNLSLGMPAVDSYKNDPVCN